MTETRNASPDTLGGGVKAAVLEWLAPYKQEYRAPHDRLVELVVAALTPPINDSGEGEPVAWFRQSVQNPAAWYQVQDDERRFYEQQGQTVLPLYAAPSPKGPSREQIIAAMSVELEKHPALASPISAMVWATRAYDAALSNPAQALPDARGICEALGFDPTNHHNAAACPYCIPDEALRAEIKARFASPHQALPDGEVVKLLDRLQNATMRLMGAWPEDHIPGGKLCVEVSEALNASKSYLAALSKPSSRNGAV